MVVGWIVNCLADLHLTSLKAKVLLILIIYLSPSHLNLRIRGIRSHLTPSSSLFLVLTMVEKWSNGSGYSFQTFFFHNSQLNRFFLAHPNITSFSFPFYTISNLLPRALHHHQWYHSKFEVIQFSISTQIHFQILHRITQRKEKQLSPSFYKLTLIIVLRILQLIIITSLELSYLNIFRFYNFRTYPCGFLNLETTKIMAMPYS